MHYELNGHVQYLQLFILLILDTWPKLFLEAPFDCYFIYAQGKFYAAYESLVRQTYFSTEGRSVRAFVGRPSKTRPSYLLGADLRTSKRIVKKTTYYRGLWGEHTSF